MAIKDLLQDHSTLDQLEILMRADRLPCGRYYGGDLTDYELEALTIKKTERRKEHPPCGT